MKQIFTTVDTENTEKEMHSDEGAIWLWRTR